MSREVMFRRGGEYISIMKSFKEWLFEETHEEVRMKLSDLKGLVDKNVPIGKMIEQERNYLNNLKGRIEREGLQNPLTILVSGKEAPYKPYQIWDGMHRLIVLDELGYEEVPVRFIRRVGKGEEFVDSTEVDM